MLADRYTPSNAVHQTSKLAEADQARFLDWLRDFEYDKLGLPEPDLVLLLDVPTDRSEAMLRRREADTKTKGDIHETDSAYLAACRTSARRAAEVWGWTRINCLNGAGELRSIDEIHEEIWQAVRPLLEKTKEK